MRTALFANIKKHNERKYVALYLQSLYFICTYKMRRMRMVAYDFDECLG